MHWQGTQPPSRLVSPEISAKINPQHDEKMAKRERDNLTDHQKLAKVRMEEKRILFELE